MCRSSCWLRPRLIQLELITSPTAQRLLPILLYIFIILSSSHSNTLVVQAGVPCNSQFCPNYGKLRCETILECNFGSCYNKYTFDRGTQKVRYVESGCSTEFQPSVVGKCVGDTKEGYTCVCDDSPYCNYNHRQLLEADAHRRPSAFPLRRLSCLYTDDQSVCYQYGFGASTPCNVTGRSYCMVEKTAGGDFVRRGAVDYVGHFERAAARLTSANAGEWLCEELEYQTRWRCTCRTSDCANSYVTELAMSAKIDRSVRPIVCRDFDSSIHSNNKDDSNRTCLGHVCTAEYERTLAAVSVDSDQERTSDHPEPPEPPPRVKELTRFVLGCRNFSRPELFYGWAYNKAYGYKQKGQMFCRSSMCNDFNARHFTNASFRLEASVGRSASSALISVASMITVLILTALLSLNSG